MLALLLLILGLPIYIFPPNAQVGCHYFVHDPQGRFSNAGFVLADAVASGHLEDGFFVASDVYNMLEDTPRAHCEAKIRKTLGSTAFVAGRVTAGGHDLVPPNFESEHPNRFVIFGDSLSDTGNMKADLGLIPSSSYFAGRFSSGPNWADYLDIDARFITQNLAYGGVQTTAFNDAQDWMTYVSAAGRNTITGSFERQIADYLSNVGHKIQAPEKTIFMFWAGANDYISKTGVHFEINHSFDDPSKIRAQTLAVERSTGVIVEQIVKLIEAGAKNFLIFNMPDMGVLPMVPHSEIERQYELSVQLTEAARQHNDELKHKISKLRKAYKTVKIVELDVFNLLEQLTSSGGRDYGFDYTNRTTVLTHETLPSIVTHHACYRGPYVKLSDFWAFPYYPFFFLFDSPRPVCENPSTQLFWDEVHPSSRTQCWLAYWVERTLAKHGLAQQEETVHERLALCQMAS